MSSTSKIDTRLACERDGSAIASLLFESFVEFKSLYTSEGFAATAITREQIIDRMHEGPVWIAEVGEVTVGTASAVAREDSLYVRGMAVHPHARGQHIGELFLIQIEEFAKKKAFRRLFLSTTPFLDRAIRLYEGFGFLRTAEGPDNLFGTPLFTMEKTL